MNLTGQTILITGGSSGIGFALAERFVKWGNEVIACGRRRDALEETKAKIPDLNIMVGDTGTAASREALWSEVTKNFPKVNVLINNAGIQNKIDVQNPDAWENVRQEIGINLEGPIHLSFLAIPHFMKQPHAAILNVSSGLAFSPAARVPIYCATKAALHSFTMSLRHQLAKTPIEVIEIIPPAVRTNLGGSHDFGAPLDEYADSVMAQLQEKRIETTYEFSAKGSQASRAELDEMFKRMNGA